MFKKKLYTESYKFCIKNQKWSKNGCFYLPKCILLRQGSMIFYLFLFSESPKSLLHNVVRLFFEQFLRFFNCTEPHNRFFKKFKKTLP